jgi:hypothetical protein
MKRWFLIITAILAIGAVIFIAALPAMKRHGEQLGCSSQMHGILFATLMFCNDHGGRLPSDFLSMSNELSTPEILICPGDHSHQLATSWASFTTNNCSYEIDAPGIYKINTNVVFLRCKIHDYVGYADGRVLDDSGRVVVSKRFW